MRSRKKHSTAGWIYNFYLAKKQGNKPHKVILEHIVIVAAVIIIANYIGMVASRIVK